MLPVLLLLALVSSAIATAAGIPANHYLQQVLEHAAENTPRFLAIEQPEVFDFHLWQAHEFQDRLMKWKDKYPDLVRVTTSQEAYGLPRAGGKDDCLFAEGDGCPNFILTMQDFVVHPENSESSNSLPEVFWSGCLHGNERVGPTAVMEAMTLLLEAATCEAKPNHSNHEKESWATELAEAKECRQALQDKGIDDLQRRWLARLVTTRRIVMTPTTNALGYARNHREEGAIDPNRDFPYDLEQANLCMQTIAGRTVNEIYREHMFQMALTFHGGMEVVAYEWGAPTWLNHLSPDDEAQKQVASAYSKFGGGWSNSKPYNYGNMNDEVYYVRGGMEDWAYAASWDPDRVIQCQPETFGGYPAEKTVYNNSTLRVFNMLIETSQQKAPRKSELGSSLDILNRDTSGNGHVSRNVRLALLAADLVQPYVSIVGVNNLALSDDVVPLTKRGGQTCQTSKAVTVPGNAGEVAIEWTVGGAISIDETEVWYAKWDDIPKGQIDCLTQPDSMTGFTKGTIIEANNGTGAFSRAGSHPSPDFSKTGTLPSLGPLFRATIVIPDGLETMDKLVVIALARVDKDWANPPANVAPNVSPQSHVANARTNPDWYHESAGKVIKGRVDWYSIPLTIVIGAYEDSIGKQGDQQVNTIEFKSRSGDSTGISKGGVRPKSADTEQMWFPVSGWGILLGSLLIWSCGFCVLTVIRQGRRTGTRAKRSDVVGEDDGFVFDAKPYSDALAGEEEEESDDEIEFGTLA